MFGVLMITLLLTVLLVGSNMDIILKQGISYPVRAEITESPTIAKSFATVIVMIFSINMISTKKLI